MHINKQEILLALEQVKPGLSGNEIIEQTTGFCFAGTSIRTFNDMVAISTPFETDFSGVVDAGDFYKLIQKFPDETLEVSVEDSQLLIKGKRAKAGINFNSSVLPEILPPKKRAMMDLPEDFCETIKFCSFSAGRNMTRPELTCVKIEGAYAISCDGFRATSMKMLDRLQKLILLPASIINDLVKYNPTKYGLTEGWIHFQNEDKVIFSCRSIDHEYSDLGDIFKVKKRKGKITLPRNFAEVIDRTQIMATAEFELDRLIKLSLTKNKLVCRGEGKTGWIEERARIAYDGEPITISLHPTFLAEILPHLSEGILCEDKISFSGKNFQHVICLE